MLFAYLFTTDLSLQRQIAACKTIAIAADPTGLRYERGQPILLDQNWPNVWDVLYGQREHHIIMLVDDDNLGDVHEYLTAGAADYVPKALIEQVLPLRLQAQQNPAFITEFVRRMAHDVKNPLASVRGYAQALTDPDMREHIDVDEMEDFLSTIVDNAKRTEAMINRVRDTAFTEYRAHHTRPKHLNLPELIHEEVEQFAPLIDAQGHYFMTEIAPGLPRVWADPWLIKQVLTALLHNSLMYTPPNGTLCIIADLIQEKGRDVVRVIVADSGIGIPAENQPKVFTRWFSSQVDHEARDWRLGISLYQAQRVITAHGGRMWFESEPGQGTTFYFTLPVAT